VFWLIVRSNPNHTLRADVLSTPRHSCRPCNKLLAAGGMLADH
jgi:hypothetical protein